MTATETIDLDWKEPEDLAAEHSARAARACERLEAIGCMVLDAHLEPWVYEGRVNVSPRAGLKPYWQRLYTRRIVIVAVSPGATGTGDIAISLTVERYGQGGAVRDRDICMGAPRCRELSQGVHWREACKSYLARGYRLGHRVIDVVTEGPEAVAARKALGLE